MSTISPFRIDVNHTNSRQISSITPPLTSMEKSQVHMIMKNHTSANIEAFDLHIDEIWCISTNDYTLHINNKQYMIQAS